MEPEPEPADEAPVPEVFDLPDGWVQMYDDKEHRTYFSNVETGKALWSVEDVETAAKEEAEMKAAAAARKEAARKRQEEEQATQIADEEKRKKYEEDMARRRAAKEEREAREKAEEEERRRKLPRYRCHLGCILLKMAAISLLTGQRLLALIQPA